MRDSVHSRLSRLEKAYNSLPHAIVKYADGHIERLDFHDIAVAFSERNRAGIVSLEWENPHDTEVVFQLLASPETWELLSAERIKENEQDKNIL